MVIRTFFLAAVTLAFLGSFSVCHSQNIEQDADKEKKTKEQNERVMLMLDKAASEAVELRLPQNRAVVYALAADMYWKLDTKRGRELFQNSAAEIIAFNQETEKERRDLPNPGVSFDMFDTRGDIRNEILPLVAKHDAELALELLVQTRSARLTESIARVAATKPTNDITSYSPERVRVSQELALEQQFALMAADENPDRAIKLIKDSLSKGISMNVIPLLEKLYKKDEKKALDLAGDVIKKILDMDLTKGMEDMQIAFVFLQYSSKAVPESQAKGKQFRFTDSQVKDLANKIANSILSGPKSFMMSDFLMRAMPMLEKLIPDRVAALKQRQAENDAGMPPDLKRMQEQQRMFDPNATPEDIIAQLPKLQNEFEKAIAYQSLSSKIAEIEDDARARKLIDQIPDEKTKAALLEIIESSKIDRNAAAGRLEDARKLISNLNNRRTQIQKCVALALDFHRKGGEKDIAVAVGLMKDARALAAEYPETMEEIVDVMEIVRGYATVEKDTAFRMFEPVVDRINEHMQASATLARFNPKSGDFKKGELILSVTGRRGSTPLVDFIPQIQSLGKADLDRMMAVSERFSRSDARAVAKLYVLQGFLKEEKKPANETLPR